jgi:hypothetical protein
MLSVMIEQLKEKYRFKEDCDFYAWLRDLKNWSESYNEHEDLTVIREMEAQFTNIITASNALNDLITNFLRRREDFSKYLDPFQDEILSHSPKLELTHEELQEILMDFKVNWQKTLESLPPIGKGRPSKTHNQRFVNLLVMMFMDGSQLEPQCYRNEHQKGQYHGCFYDFMIDMLPVLRFQGITLGIKNESLGRYACELIPQRRKDDPFSSNISQIDAPLLQE